MFARTWIKWDNLQFRGLVYSLLLHLLLLIVFFISTYSPAYQNIDYLNANNLGGFSQPKTRPAKKMIITDMQKKSSVDEKIIPNQNAASNASNETSNENSSELNSAQDIAFHSDVSPPRPISVLRKIYPEKARQKEIEAVAFTSVVISSSGKVLAVTVSGVKLKKKTAVEIDAVLKNEFAIAAKEILAQARFTPAVVRGKNTPVIMDIPLNFTLD